MSTFHMPDSETTWGTPEEAPRTHSLAIGSLISSLIICCPLVTVLGPLLGVIALVGISGNPMRRGRGIAVAGILIGTVATGIWVYGAIEVYRTFIQPLMRGPVALMAAGEAGDWNAVRSKLAGSAAQASDEELAAFFEALGERAGALRSMTPHQNQSATPDQAPDGSGRVLFEYDAVFDRETMTLVVEWLIVDPSGFVMKPESLLFEASDGTAFEFPAITAAPGAVAPSGPGARDAVEPDDE